MRLPRLEELGQHQPGEVPSRRQPNSSSDILTLSSSQLAAQGKATASIVVAFGLSPLAEGQVCVRSSVWGSGYSRGQTPGRDNRKQGQQTISSSRANNAKSPRG